MNWDVFFSVMAALVAVDVVKGIPGFIRGFKRGYRLSRYSKKDRHPFEGRPCGYPGGDRPE